MEIDLLGTAAPSGWPSPGCRCASCSRLRAASITLEPTSILIDGLPLQEHVSQEVPGGLDIRTASGRRVLISGGPGMCPEPASEVIYDAVLLDLAGHPSHLGLLRHQGAVLPSTAVHAIYLDHRLPSPAELTRRLSFWTQPRTGPHRTLILGGSRSGKSAEAELRLITHPTVTYIATGPVPHPGDPEWASRVSAHRSRRPAWWSTLETTDLPKALTTIPGALLIDGLGTWLTSVMDRSGAWDSPATMKAFVRPHVDALIAAWRRTESCVIAVSDEVGLSLVPETTSGRTFRDLLGDLNQRLAAESEESALVVAGRPLDLTP